MKTIMIILSTFILINFYGYGQKDLSHYKGLDGIYIKSYWGDINITGTSSASNTEFNLEAKFTDTSKKGINIDNLSDYVSFEVINNKLHIKAREPKGFESIDLNLKIPEHLILEIEHVKGGNIYASNLKNGVEINILNGSVKLERISKYALVNAANGEINASFDKIDNDYPISLVTMNGGVTIILPEDSKRELRLISRKNGFVESDFSLDTDTKIINLNTKQYSKQPIMNTARINGGGSLLFLSTENGPIAIKKGKA